MKAFILVLFLTFETREATTELRRWNKDDEVKAVAMLAEQLVKAMTNYISDCYTIPIEKSCHISSRSMDDIKNDIKSKRDLVKLLVWNRNLEIVEVLSLSNPKSQELSEMQETVLLIHDMGESSCSSRFRKLIRRSYVKNPNATVLSLDYSSIVSIHTYV